MNDKKLRNYWDKHSIADLWDKLPDANLEFKRPQKIIFTMRIDKDVLEKIKEKAQIKGLGYSAYIRSILTEMVNKETLP